MPSWKVNRVASITNRPAWTVGGLGPTVGKGPFASNAIQINANGQGPFRFRTFCPNQLGNIGGGLNNSMFSPSADGTNGCRDQQCIAPPYCYDIPYTEQRRNFYSLTGNTPILFYAILPNETWIHMTNLLSFGNAFDVLPAWANTSTMKLYSDWLRQDLPPPGLIPVEFIRFIGPHIITNNQTTTTNLGSVGGNQIVARDTTTNTQVPVFNGPILANVTVPGRRDFGTNNPAKGEIARINSGITNRDPGSGSASSKINIQESGMFSMFVTRDMIDTIERTTDFEGAWTPPIDWNPLLGVPQPKVPATQPFQPGNFVPIVSQPALQAPNNTYNMGEALNIRIKLKPNSRVLIRGQARNYFDSSPAAQHLPIKVDYN